MHVEGNSIRCWGEHWKSRKTKLIFGLCQLIPVLLDPEPVTSPLVALVLAYLR